MRYFIYKEFAKFRLGFYVFAISAIYCVAWIYFDLSDSIDKFSITSYTLQLMYNKVFSYNHLDELNLLFAVIIAILSMFYERQNARIRLQLHFPQSYSKNIMLLTLVPLCFLLFVYIFEILALFLVFTKFFPIEISNALLITLINNIIFSVGLYFVAQSMMVEPNNKRAIGILLIGVICVWIYFKLNPDVGNSSYYYLNEIVWCYFALWVVFGAMTLLYSLKNYKRGYIKWKLQI